MAEEAATVPYIKVLVIREKDRDPEGDAAGVRAELRSTDSCNGEPRNRNQDPQYRGSDERHLTTCLSFMRKTLTDTFKQYDTDVSLDNCENKVDFFS